MGARQTALSALIACRKVNAWSDGILKEYIARDRLDRRDAALASRLCYGVLQNRMLLDFYISRFLRGNLKDLQPVVLDILRLAVYQITYSDRIPDAAAVNEAVEQTKKAANARAAGLVNGVLRSIVRAEGKLPEPPDLETKYSHPKALVALLRESIGEAALEPMLRADNEAPKTALQVNTLKTNHTAVRAALTEQGIAFEEHPWMPDCLLVSGAGSVDGLSLYQNGAVFVQDPAARQAARAAGLRPGMRVLDVCAAPGGKSFAAAMEMENQGEILSTDLREHKLSQITAGAERLGITIVSTRVQDASEYDPSLCASADAVLADVPCSGLGVIRKKPDIRYKNPDEMVRLPEVQLRILKNVSRYVRPGGILLYSTCTLLRRENEDVIAKFLSETDGFSTETIELPPPLTESVRGMATFLPGRDDCDGFFICRMRAKA